MCMRGDFSTGAVRSFCGAESETKISHAQNGGGQGVVEVFSSPELTLRADSYFESIPALFYRSDM